MNVNKIYIEYPGYSHFSLSSDLNAVSLQNDMNSILNDVFENIPNDAKIIMYGRSIGTAVMCKYAKQFSTKIHGIILETPFLSLTDLYSWYFGLLIGWILNIEEWDLKTFFYIRDLNLPTLIFSAKNDTITPDSHSKYIYNNMKTNDIHMISYENEYHGMKFKKIEDDLNLWLKNFLKIVK